MTEKDQNLAIAEFMGWKKGREICEGEWVWNNPDGQMRGQICIPNFVNDLNAIHDAENVLNIDQVGEYETKLYSVTHQSTYDLNPAVQLFWSQHHYYRVLHADAAQRAEALLRTIGRWREGKEKLCCADGCLPQPSDLTGV